MLLDKTLVALTLVSIALVTAGCAETGLTSTSSVEAVSSTSPVVNSTSPAPATSAAVSPTTPSPAPATSPSAAPLEVSMPEDARVLLEKTREAVQAAESVSIGTFGDVEVEYMGSGRLDSTNYSVFLIGESIAEYRLVDGVSYMASNFFWLGEADSEDTAFLSDLAPVVVLRNELGMITPDTVAEEVTKGTMDGVDVFTVGTPDGQIQLSVAADGTWLPVKIIKPTLEVQFTDWNSTALVEAPSADELPPEP